MPSACRARAKMVSTCAGTSMITLLPSGERRASAAMTRRSSPAQPRNSPVCALKKLAACSSLTHRPAAPLPIAPRSWRRCSSSSSSVTVGVERPRFPSLPLWPLPPRRLPPRPLPCRLPPLNVSRRRAADEERGLQHSTGFSTGARVLWRPTRNATPHKKAAWSARMRTVPQNVPCRH